MCSLYFFLICVHCIIRLSGYHDLSLSKSSATSQCFCFFPLALLGVIQCNDHWHFFSDWAIQPRYLGFWAGGYAKPMSHFQKFVMATKPHKMTIFCKNFRCFEFTISSLFFFQSSAYMSSESQKQVCKSAARCKLSKGYLKWVLDYLTHF